MRCFGAPVLDAQGRVAGAVSIAGPAWRMTRERLELLGPEVAAAGRRIGAQLRPLPVPAAGAPAVPVAGPPAFRGAAPRWDAAAGALWWCDALAPALRRLRDGTDREVVRFEAPVRAMILAEGGGVVVMDAAGAVLRVDPDGAARALPALPAPPLALAVRPGGEVWAAEGGAIGPLSAEGAVRPAWRLPGEVASLAWEGGGAALYAAIPASGAVHRLEVGRAAPLILTRLPPGGGRPSGLAVDAQGGVWTALQDGWGVARLGADGEVERLLPLPVPRPTDLGFGGPRLEVLHVATARDGLALDALAAAPLSGRLLTLGPGVAGLPEPAARWP